MKLNNEATFLFFKRNIIFFETNVLFWKWKKLGSLNLPYSMLYDEEKISRRI